ncbi:MAG: hypothetical protein V1656_00480 [Candidatus Jorgensenbacteria bacterium]
MIHRKAEIKNKIGQLVKLGKALGNSKALSPIEQAELEKEERFEATYYSNKLEGNKLSKHEARRAILPE